MPTKGDKGLGIRIPNRQYIWSPAAGRQSKRGGHETSALVGLLCDLLRVLFCRLLCRLLCRLRAGGGRARRASEVAHEGSWGSTFSSAFEHFGRFK
eukprot:5558112-Prymnesium_polylepis.1